MVPLDVSFSLLIEDQGLLKFDISVILDPFDSCDLCCILGLCHSFKSCALPLSLLLQFVYLRQKQGRDTHLEKKEGVPA